MVCSRAAPDWTAGSVRHGEEGWTSISVPTSRCAVKLGGNIKEVSGKRAEVCSCGPSGSIDVYREIWEGAACVCVWFQL